MRVLFQDSRHSDQLNKADAGTDCSDLKKRHILTAAAIHDRPLFGMDWKKFNYCLIRPKFGTIVISKEAQDRASGILTV